MKTMKQFSIVLLLSLLAFSFTSCEKNNDLDEFTQGVQITVEKGEKGAPDALGTIWFINNTVAPGKELPIKIGWEDDRTFREIDIPDGTEPMIIRLPATGHNNRYSIGLINSRTGGHKLWDIEVPKGKIQKILIKQYKKKLSIYFNEKVLFKDL